MSKTIMVVDDSSTMRSLVATYLGEMGYEGAIEARSGFEALKLLPTTQIDLIITDINMPDINGLELINFIKGSTIYRHIPVIVITTERGEADRERSMALGAREYLVKPFAAADLKNAVRRVLGRKAQ